MFMKKPCQCLAVAVAALSAVLNSGQAQVLQATTAPAQNWVALSSSADGIRLAAVASYGWLYLSTNSGATWSAASTATTGAEPQRPWTSVASSSDGNRLIAVANFMPPFVSTNSGATWQPRGPSAVWSAVAASADGLKVVATDHDQGVIYTSADGGGNWNLAGAPNRRWRSVASSADGTRLVAGADFGTNYGEPPAIYISKDAGVNWTLTSAPAYPWQSIASSADGTRLAAGAYGGLIYLSSDGGQTWRPANVPSLRWGAVRSSTDGTRLVAGSWEGAVYLSTDSGQTWSTARGPAAPWQAVASSADGSRIFAGIWDVSQGGIYKANVAPVLNIATTASGTVLSWEGPADAYLLQQRQNLTSGDWQLVNAVPTVSNGKNQVLIDSKNGHSVFRLIQQQVP